jgi:hypothetical protein
MTARPRVRQAMDERARRRWRLPGHYPAQEITATKILLFTAVQRAGIICQSLPVAVPDQFLGQFVKLPIRLLLFVGQPVAVMLSVQVI